MEYKALSQTTYKFTSIREATIQGADVLNSDFRFGTIKTTSGMIIQLSPSIYYQNYENNTFSLNISYTRNSASNNAYARGKLYSCVVDGNTYYGTKQASFNLGNVSEIGSEISLANGTLKVLRYDNITTNIVLDEYSTNGISIVFDNSGNVSYDRDYSYYYLKIPKTTNDIILAVWWEKEATETTSE